MLPPLRDNEKSAWLSLQHINQYLMIYLMGFKFFLTNLSTNMNKKIFGMAFVVFTGLVSTPLFADIAPAPSHPIGPTPSQTDVKANAEFLKKHAEYYRSLEVYENSLAKQYGDQGNNVLKAKHEALASHEKAIASEYEPK